MNGDIVHHLRETQQQPILITGGRQGLRLFRIFVLPGDSRLVARESQPVPIGIGAVLAWKGHASDMTAALEASA
jgi:hypothetical protein